MIHHDTPSPPPAAQKGLLDAPPRTTFVLGVFVGIAVTSIVALLLILPRIGASSTAKNTNTALGTTATGDTQAPPPAEPAQDATKIAKPSKDDYYRGVAPEKADIVLVEYSDYQCPFCSRLHPTMKQLMKDYEGKISWVYRHFPLTSIHPNAQPAAEAAECAGELGGNEKFWEFSDKLFENQTTLGSSLYTQLAKDLKINEATFASCISSGKHTATVNAELTEGSNAGVNGTPGTFIFKGTDPEGAQLIAGALPYESFKAAIDQLL